MEYGDPVLVRNDGILENGKWHRAFYAFEYPDAKAGEPQYATVGGARWERCLPLNKETEVLAGTRWDSVADRKYPHFEFGERVKFLVEDVGQEVWREGIYAQETVKGHCLERHNVLGRDGSVHTVSRQCIKKTSPDYA